MGLETGSYIDDLVTTNPAAGDNPSKGDDHLRLIKTCLKGSFPSLGAAAVNLTAAQLNSLERVTGTFTVSSVLGSTWTAVQSIAHGITTDDVDFGCTVFGGGPGILPFQVQAFVIGTDKRFDFFGDNQINGTSPPTITAASTGNVDFYLYNSSSTTQDLTCKYWIQRR